MLADLIDASFPSKFVDTVGVVFGGLLLVMVLVLLRWSRNRLPDGPRLTLCIAVVSVFLPYLRGWVAQVLIWTSGYQALEWEWTKRVTAVIFTAAYVWALLALSKMLLRRSREVRSGPLKCFQCGCELCGKASGMCPRCGSAYQIVPRYEVNLSKRE